MGDPRTAEIFQDFAKIFLRDRPQNHGVRKSALPSQVSGDSAEFRQVGRNFPESRPFAAEPGEWRIREPPKISRAAGDISTQSTPSNGTSQSVTSVQSVEYYLRHINDRRDVTWGRQPMFPSLVLLSFHFLLYVLRKYARFHYAIRPKRRVFSPAR